VASVVHDHPAVFLLRLPFVSPAYYLVLLIKPFCRHAMARMVSRRFLTAEARVQSQGSPCGGQSSTGKGIRLSRYTAVFSCQCNSSTAPYSFTYHSRNRQWRKNSLDTVFVSLNTECKATSALNTECKATSALNIECKATSAPSRIIAAMADGVK
jgi:hypothetical protein